MALTFSNRETFLVLQWLEGVPERQDFFRKLATTLARITTETAVPRLADAILAELESELPKLDGIAGEMPQSGLRRVAFYELALALILETGARRLSQRWLLDLARPYPALTAPHHT